MLFLYFIGISTSLIVHHHEDHIVPFEQATQCEKAIFYGSTKNVCHHKEHISIAFHKCWLCEHIIVTPHLLATNDCELFIEKIFFPQHFIDSKRNQSISQNHTLNRGPPIL